MVLNGMMRERPLLHHTITGDHIVFCTITILLFTIVIVVIIMTSLHSVCKKISTPNQTTSRPVMYIRYGPSGSGKSTALNNVVQQLHKHNNTHLEIISVDDVLEKDSIFVEERRIINDKYSKETVTRQTLLGDLYKNRRVYADIKTATVSSNALSRGYSVSHETTGVSISWIQNEAQRFKDRGYRIALLHNDVHFDILKLRLSDREKHTLQISPSDDELERMWHVSKHNLAHLKPLADKVYVVDSSRDYY